MSRLIISCLYLTILTLCLSRILESYYKLYILRLDSDVFSIDYT